ncbi:MAG: Colicin I receptor precursor [Syntrophaceae bacterium PtaB.Bin038]|nr:MAG: Colicin I receptor precursor [Syntrophaceae bacterium PtaB.Bin038]
MKGIIQFVACSLLLCGMSAPANGQAVPPAKESVRMDEVVVMATRDRQEVRKVPANVTVITAEDIANSGATNLAEVLTGLDGVYVRSTSGNAAQATVDMRGFGENGFGRTAVTLDGRKLNRPDMASVNWLEIPLGEIDRIEISRGAASVLYGDAAIAGTINIVTKRGEGPPKVDIGFIGGSFGSHNERATAKGSVDKFYYAVNGEHLHTDGYRDRSKFTSGSGGVNLGYADSDRFDVSLGIGLNRTDYQLPGYLTRAQLEQDRRQAQPGVQNDDARNDSMITNLLIKSALGEFGRFDLNLIWGTREVTTKWDSFLSYSVVDIDTIGATPKYVLDRKIFGRDNKLTLGVDVYRDQFDKDAFADPRLTVKNNMAEIERKSLGGYIRDDFNLLQDLILTLGARLERVEINGKFTDLLTSTTVFDSEKIHKGEAYEAALTYLFGERSRAFVKYARVFRIPFLDEQASYYGFGTDAFYTDLEKETGNSYEAGVTLYPLKDLKLAATVYRIDMEDEIKYVSDPLTFTGRNVNLDKTRHEGLELSMAYELKKWFRLTANYTLQNVTFRAGANSDKDVPLVPAHMANGALEIFLPWNLTLRPEIRYVGSQYLGQDDDNSSPKLDSYTLYNLYLTWKPTVAGYRLTAFAGVENIGDEKYSSYAFESAFLPGGAAFYPVAGINYRAGLTVHF